VVPSCAGSVVGEVLLSVIERHVSNDDIATLVSGVDAIGVRIERVVERPRARSTVVNLDPAVVPPDHVVVRDVSAPRRENDSRSALADARVVENAVVYNNVVISGQSGIVAVVYVYAPADVAVDAAPLHRVAAARNVDPVGRSR
jgi:hypothetical protein